MKLLEGNKDFMRERMTSFLGCGFCISLVTASVWFCSETTSSVSPRFTAGYRDIRPDSFFFGRPLFFTGASSFSPSAALTLFSQLYKGGQ